MRSGGGGAAVAATGGGSPLPFLLLLPRGFLLLLGACSALALEISISPTVRAFVGEPALLKCSFRSSSPITESLLVDWTYRPLTGGQMETIFHYQAGPYPAPEGRFKGRISWLGDVARGDASIAIQNPGLSDNGTFSCSVKNPPDMYHSIPQTALLVTQRGLTSQREAAAQGSSKPGAWPVWTQMRRIPTDGRPELQQSKAPAQPALASWGCRLLDPPRQAAGPALILAGWKRAAERINPFA
ncbi:myelin protein zero-like protein 3 isoform X2 [Melanerpes formicivorus]|uniref:myelin protein zero-like protein 3 isoform X2 n=1 Tax=Melanerpes formicivorus TaxID=211600 RepID=UPI00358DE580